MKCGKFSTAFYVLFVLLVSQSSAPEKVHCENPSLEQENPKLLSENWLSAVATNNMEQSLLLARKLVPDVSKIDIPRSHLALAEREGVRGEFFKAQFNFWDYQLWRHALFFHRLAEELAKGNPDTLKILFDAVAQRVEPVEKGSNDIPWPYRIWEREYGVCDRQAWVFCELAYQLGWETQVVYLWDDVTKKSPHTIAEVRKDGKVYFIDVLYTVFLEKSVAEVANDDDLLEKIWNQQELRDTIKTSLFWTPSYPQDYCPRNQELYNILKYNLGNRCPRFGVPPDKRLATYKELGQNTTLDKPRFQMGLWFYPFRLLRAHIIGYYRLFGIDYVR